MEARCIDATCSAVCFTSTGELHERVCAPFKLFEHDRVHRRVVGDDLGGRDLGRADRQLEEPPRSLGVATHGHEHVDDLPELIDGAIDVAPLACDLHVGLVDLAAVANSVPTGPGSLDQQRREAADPAIDGGVVDLDAALGEQLLDVAVRQREAQVPAHREDDHRLCCVWSGPGMLTPTVGLRSDRQGQLVERDRQPPVHRLLHRKLVPSTS
jgi:hypothetical protein